MWCYELIGSFNQFDMFRIAVPFKELAKLGWLIYVRFKQKE